MEVMMKKILYCKYNSFRRPEFQLKTSVIDIDGERYVEKAPLNELASKGINSIKNSYELLGNAYKTIKPISYTVVEEGLRFPFLTGKSIDSPIDYVNGDVDEIIEEIEKLLAYILEYQDDVICEFEMTDDFSKMFPNCCPKEKKAYRVANLDSIFSNFICDGNDIVCIDYEWVVDFPIPEGYLKYRTLFYLYMEHMEFLKEKCDIDFFLKRFGFDDEAIAVYQNMEDSFQEYVHGENRKYIYTQNYNSKRIKVSDLNNLLEMKDNHINNIQMENEAQKQQIEVFAESMSKTEAHVSNLEMILEERERMINEKDKIINNQQDYINKLKKAIRNPIYASQMVAKKIVRKVAGTKTNDADDEINGCETEGIDPDYENWITNLEANETYEQKFEYNPKISILVPVYNVLDKHLIPCIESVINQVYDNWELCLADDCSTWDNVKQTLKKYENNEKIQVVYRSENGHISRCTNSALEVATGDYIAFLDCDDILRPNALYEMVKKLNEDSTLDFVYSDEDKVDDDGKNRHMPHFKPDWSPDTLMTNMYTCHFSIYRRTIANELGGIRPGYEGAQDYDFTLRFTEKTNRIGHVPKILYHWRERVESTAARPEAKPYILEAAKKSKLDAIERRGLKAELELIDGIFQYRVNYISQTNPLVSIIIPSKDNYEILKRCIDSLFEKTLYKNFEVILVDNGSSEENKRKYTELSKLYNINYIYEKMDFNFSKMCNLGAENANGSMLLFLNDDIEIIDGEWLQRMVGQAELPHTGAVGAKLLYPDSKNIQHCGVIEIENGPCHAFANYSDEPIYYFGRNRLDYNYLAVTAACLMVSKEKYEEISGFDESLAVTYNDIDLCFKLVEAGYYNVVRNDVILYHYESVSRGNDLVDKAKMKRLLEEQKNLYAHHPRFDKKDPFYNPNLAQQSVGFGYNYSLGNDVKHYINESPKLDIKKSNIRVSIDKIDINNSISIEGWAFRPKENCQEPVIIYFESDNKCYTIETAKVYRKDVQDIFRRECSSGFIGFRTEFSIDDIDEGIYKIGIIIADDMIFTKSELKL